MKSIGVDIVEVDRINSLVKNSRFLNRVFSEQEIKYCKSKKNSGQHFAVRFAAKEAVWKAINQQVEKLDRSLSKLLTHRNISIKNLPEGNPKIVLPLKLRKLENKISVSLSHTKKHAIAVAMFE